ncbi:hypothetical protein ACWDV4_01265 [Micromonospora sp. NPDC003197]
MEEVVFGDVLGPLLGTLPSLLVLLVGLILVLVAGKRLPGRARVLAVLGGAILSVGLLLGMAWTLAIPTLIREGHLAYGDFNRYNLFVTVVLSLMQAAGFGLLIGALLSARTAPVAPPAMPAAPSPAWPGTPMPAGAMPAPYPPAAAPASAPPSSAPPAPYPPAAAPPAPTQWTPPRS